jgi:hypothetical protein
MPHKQFLVKKINGELPNAKWDKLESEKRTIEI